MELAYKVLGYKVPGIGRWHALESRLKAQQSKAQQSKAQQSKAQQSIAQQSTLRLGRKKRRSQRVSLGSSGLSRVIASARQDPEST